MHTVRAIHPNVGNQYSSLWKQNTVNWIDKKSDPMLQILCSSISKESGVVSMLAAKLFLAADHKQTIFMLTNGGKHALPLTVLLPSLVKRSLPLSMCKTNAESVIYAPTQICCERACMLLGLENKEDKQSL